MLFVSLSMSASSSAWSISKVWTKTLDMYMTSRNNKASHTSAVRDLARIPASFDSPLKTRKTRSSRSNRRRRRVRRTDIPESALSLPIRGVSSQASSDPSRVQAKSKGPQRSQQKAAKPLALIRSTISTQNATRNMLSIAIMTGDCSLSPVTSMSTPMNAELRRIKTPKTMLPLVVFTQGTPTPFCSSMSFCWITCNSWTTGCTGRLLLLNFTLPRVPRLTRLPRKVRGTVSSSVAGLQLP
mmetsp:Transcript_91207/g.253957  ORF Transcript_91207/g.253957 Transcript_91207/m.253957 type:complete len:241 (+) Transcript_91207:609-1331(+)